MKDSVYINGLGIVAGQYESFDHLINDQKGDRIHIPKEVGKVAKVSKNIALRRMDRLSKMSLLATRRASIDSKLNDLEKVGTIYNTVFGPLVNNIKLSKCIINKDLETFTPSRFANTVNNISVGYICIEMGCKGVSTMLLASNHVGHSIDLLQSEKAETIFAGGVDEYSESVFDCLEVKGYQMAEGASVLVLSTKKEETSYCSIRTYVERLVGPHPYYDNFGRENQNQKEIIRACLNEVLNEEGLSSKGVDYFIMGSNCLQEYEEVVLDELGILEKSQVTRIQTDTLGANIGIGLGIGAKYIKEKKADRVLVSDFDYNGMYRVFVLGKV